MLDQIQSRLKRYTLVLTLLLGFVFAIGGFQLWQVWQQAQVFSSQSILAQDKNLSIQKHLENAILILESLPNSPADAPAKLSQYQQLLELAQAKIQVPAIRRALNAVLLQKETLEAYVSEPSKNQELVALSGEQKILLEQVKGLLEESRYRASKTALMNQDKLKLSIKLMFVVGLVFFACLLLVVGVIYRRIQSNVLKPSDKLLVDAQRQLSSAQKALADAEPSIVETTIVKDSEQVKALESENAQLKNQLTALEKRTSEQLASTNEAQQSLDDSLAKSRRDLRKAQLLSRQLRAQLSLLKEKQDVFGFDFPLKRADKKNLATQILLKGIPAKLEKLNESDLENLDMAIASWLENPADIFEMEYVRNIDGEPQQWKSYLKAQLDDNKSVSRIVGIHSEQHKEIQLEKERQALIEEKEYLQGIVEQQKTLLQDIEIQDEELQTLDFYRYHEHVDDAEMEALLLDYLPEAFSERVAEIKTSIQNRSIQQAQQQTQSLSELAALIGAMSLKESCQTLQMAMVDEEVDATEPLSRVEDACQQVNLVIEEL